MSTLSLLERATRMAVQAHEGQVRKEAPIPYITHPVQVALILATHGFSEEIIAAGLTHDVVEDTAVTAEELRTELGDTVVDIVAAVTNDDSLSWEEKKKHYIETVRLGPVGAKAVCVADKIHNMQSLLAAYEVQGPSLWEKFNAGMEKKIWFEEAVLAMLKESWNHPLIAEYEALLTKLKELA